MSWVLYDDPENHLQPMFYTFLWHLDHQQSWIQLNFQDSTVIQQVFIETCYTKSSLLEIKQEYKQNIRLGLSSAVDKERE